MANADYLIINGNQHKIDADTVKGGKEPTVSTSITADYDSTSTYAAGEYCMYKGNLYKCITDIAMGEEWNVSHWQSMTVLERISEVDSGAGAKQKQIVSGSLSLLADWSGTGPYYQTVTIPGSTGNSKIDLQLNAAALAQLINDEVIAMWVENNNGIFTVWAMGAAPSTALTVQYTRTEVTA